MSLSRTASAAFFAAFSAAFSALLVVACGASEKATSPPAESPASGSRASDSVQQAPKNQDQPTRYAPPPPTASQAPTGKLPGAEPERQRGEAAWQELLAARGELDATTGDCALACKALASMDRATAHVCVVSPDEAHCGSAKDTLKTARRRVRAECMACPNGVSVDPDAPIPSTPPSLNMPK